MLCQLHITLSTLRKLGMVHYRYMYLDNLTVRGRSLHTPRARTKQRTCTLILLLPIYYTPTIIYWHELCFGGNVACTILLLILMLLESFWVLEFEFETYLWCVGSSFSKRQLFIYWWWLSFSIIGMCSSSWYYFIDAFVSSEFANPSVLHCCISSLPHE